MLNIFNLLAIDTERLLLSLDVFWKGMVAIFIVVTVIFGIIKLLNLFDAIKSKKNK